MQHRLFRQHSALKVYFFGLLLLGSVLMMRLIDVQLVRGDSFLEKADNNRFFVLPLVASRGIFFDRYQKPLVINKKQYYQLESSTALFSSMTPLDTTAALASMASDSASVTFQEQREYLYPTSLAHVLGYVGRVTADDLIDNPTLLPISLIGKSGLELKFNDRLMGKNGDVYYEINANGERQRVIRKIEPVTGENIQTTLDPYISAVADQALGDQRGVVIISDATTGEILTLISKPTFDANLMSTSFADSEQETARKKLVNNWFSDELKPFFNRAIGGTYPPGSVFKIVTAMAGLENNKLTQDTTVVDEGTLAVGDYEYRSWYYWGYGGVEGEINVIRALARSNDIFFYKTAEWVGPDLLASMARLFGFGSKVGINLTGESTGLVPDPAWKEKTTGEQWYLGNTYHFGIGQGDLSVTPLQINQMVQTIANNGTMCTPTLESGLTDTCHEVGVKEQNINLVLQGMVDVCSPGGTAFPFFPYNQQVRSEGSDLKTDLAQGAMACKTGTAEWGEVDEHGYRKTHGWWVGIINLPHDKIINTVPESCLPELTSADTDSDQCLFRAEWLKQVKIHDLPQKIVITVLVESDEMNPYKEGSEDAAPIGKSIIDWMLGQF